MNPLDASEQEARRLLVNRWLIYAMEDLLMASQALNFSGYCPTRSIAFHAQQSIEKNLKAFLVFKKVIIPHTHNLSRLLELCGEHAAWPIAMEDIDELTYHAVIGRYPEVEENIITQEEAELFIHMAERVQTVIQQDLHSQGVTLPDIRFD